MRRLSHETFTTLFGLVYLALMTNLLLVVGCLPLVVVLVLTDPANPSVLLGALVPLTAPMLAAAFTVFRAYSDNKSTDVVRGFLAGLKATWRKALGIGALATAALAFLGADAWASLEIPYAAAILPVLGVLAALVVVTALLALVALAEVPEVGLRRVIAVSAILAVRRWWLGLASLAVVATLLLLFVNYPALALGVATAPFLYAIWANSRYALRPALGDRTEPEAHPAGLAVL